MIFGSRQIDVKAHPKTAKTFLPHLRPERRGELTHTSNLGLYLAVLKAIWSVNYLPKYISEGKIDCILIVSKFYMLNLPMFPSKQLHPSNIELGFFLMLEILSNIGWVLWGFQGGIFMAHIADNNFSGGPHPGSVLYPWMLSAFLYFFFLAMNWCLKWIRIGTSWLANPVLLVSHSFCSAYISSPLLSELAYPRHNICLSYFFLSI